MATDWANHPIGLKIARGEKLTDDERAALGGGVLTKFTGHTDKSGNQDDKFFGSQSQAAATRTTTSIRLSDTDLWSNYVRQQQDIEAGGHGGIGDILDSVGNTIDDAVDSVKEFGSDIDDQISTGVKDLLGVPDEPDDPGNPGTVTLMGPLNAREDPANRRSAGLGAKGLGANIRRRAGFKAPRVTTAVLTGE